MTYRKNPFRDLSIDELKIAYVNFSQSNDEEAVKWVTDAFCLKLKLNVTFDN